MSNLTSAELLAYYMANATPRPLNQVQLAAIVGWTQSQVSKRISGKVKMREKDRELVAPAVGCLPEDLKEGAEKLTKVQLRGMRRLRALGEDDILNTIEFMARLKK